VTAKTLAHRRRTQGFSLSPFSEFAGFIEGFYVIIPRLTTEQRPNFDEFEKTRIHQVSGFEVLSFRLGLPFRVKKRLLTFYETIKLYIILKNDLS